LQVTGLDTSIPAYELWLLPGAQNQRGGHEKAGSHLVAVSFRYHSNEFYNIAWINAMKRYAASLGIANYSPRELYQYSYDAVLAWEANVCHQPTNPVLVRQLARSYAALGDLDLEISGWWKIFESHPLQISILRLLYSACLRKYSRQTDHFSLLKFVELCGMHLLSNTAGESGVGHLDWWPLASEEDLMMLEPYMEKQWWKNASSCLIQ
jgi:hypothetical protein